MSDCDTKALLASRLRTARQALGISQTELGVRMSLAKEVSSTRISRYESEDSEPDLRTITRMAKILDLPVPALVAEDDSFAMLAGAYARITDEERAAVLAMALGHLGPAETERLRAQITPQVKTEKTARGKRKR